MVRRSFAVVAGAVLALSSVPVLSGPAVAGSPLPSIEMPMQAEDPVDPNANERFIVEFTQEAQLEFATEITDRAERGSQVVDVLQRIAADSQQEAISIVMATPGARFESHWVTNALVVDGPLALRNRLAALPGVRAVDDEESYELIVPVDDRTADVADLVAPTWGVERVGAPTAWEQGILGGGIVVGSLDSGVQYDHPAIVNQYRGNLGDGSFDHNYNWFDASGDCGSTEPCDLFGHGTHTMGTMVGGHGPGPFEPDIGVAPGAAWMSVSCGPFFCTDSQLMAAAEWFIAPTDLNGENPDPSKRPDIINNSWGGGPGDPFFADYVTAWRAAGIVPVFSNGNAGPACATNGSPADYIDSYAVGATDFDDQIADFSSRGPSSFGKIGPQVSAPGVDVLSSVPGNGYEFFSGTSMAAPHVVGSLALMMSADPALRGDVDGATGLLSATALDIIDETCGGAPGGDPNNVYGDGRINAAAAIELAATGGTVAGTITADSSGAPVGGARVTAVGPDWQSSSITDAAGQYRLLVPEGTYVVLATAFGFKTAVAPAVVVETDLVVTQNLSLEALPTATLRGRTLTAEARERLPEVIVEAVGAPVPAVVSDADGFYSMTLPIGSYEIRARKGGCLTTETITVELASNEWQNFRLATKIDNAGYGCAAIEVDWVDAEHQSGAYGDDAMGRLFLPFDFPFYGETYDRVYVTTNGYLTFVDDFFGFSPGFNAAIPDGFPPNAAIYALWQDLIVDDDARISYDTIDGELGRAFVIEYDDISALGSNNRFDIEIKLWEDGTIDVLYGDGLAGVGNGAQATIGLENAVGDVGFQYSFNEASVGANTALRYETVETGAVSGVIRNANDRQPVAGITVTAQPGGRSVVTDEEGSYEILLVPGQYTLTATGNNYVTSTRRIRLLAGQERTRNFRLAAASASVVPTALEATVEEGESTVRTVVVTNNGSAPLDWELREQGDPRSFPGPALPLLSADGSVVYREPTWQRLELADEVRSQMNGGPVYTAAVDTIIDDPIDAVGGVEVIRVRGGAGSQETSIAIDFSDDTPMDDLGGFIFFDTDQDASTGLDPQALSGLPTQDVGIEYFADLFGASFGEIFIVEAETFALVAIVPALIEGQSLRFDIPFDALGDPDGSTNLAGVVGNSFEPSDWVPDVGFGTIDPFRDVPWLSTDPSAGSLEPGESAFVRARLGGADVTQGYYSGRLVLLSNDPRTRRIDINVVLDVTGEPLAQIGVGADSAPSARRR